MLNCFHQRESKVSQPKMRVYPDGVKQWWLNHNLHREDGPAIEYPDGHKQWWLNGKKVTWQQVFRQAKNPEIELRILTAALTNA